MDEGLYELLSRGRIAAKVGEAREARFYLEMALRRAAMLSNERLEALYWLSEISTDPKEKREYLTDILAAEPGNARARQKLAILDGKLDPTRMIDPDRLQPSSEPILLDQDETRRYTCPGCGGRMSFTPDGASLTCDYCEARQSFAQNSHAPAAAGAAIQEEDFLLSMATARGHIHPASTQFGSCQACGAEFILPPSGLTLSCPYCDSAYVITHAVEREGIAPAGVLPFQLSARDAQHRLAVWLAENHIQTDSTLPLPLGVYLPVWAFTMGGEVLYRGMLEDARNSKQVQGSLPVFRENLLVPASPRLSELFAEQAAGYDLDLLVPYDPRYLIDWIAENYTISVARASLDARAETFEDLKREIRQTVGNGLSDLTCSSANLTVTGFKLLLLPAWIGHFRVEDRRAEIFINGQSGKVVVRGLNSVQTWFSRLFG